VNMKPKDLFGIIVRTVGLLILLLSIIYTFYGFSIASRPPEKWRNSPSQYFILSAGLCATALYFLRGAPALVNFAYPQKKHSPNTDTFDNIDTCS